MFKVKKSDLENAKKITSKKAKEELDVNLARYEQIQLQLDVVKPLEEEKKTISNQVKTKIDNVGIFTTDNYAIKITQRKGGYSIDFDKLQEKYPDLLDLIKSDYADLIKEKAPSLVFEGAMKITDVK